MRAVVIESYGGPEVLAVRDVPAPVPGVGEVLVDVVASAVNRADLLQRMGLYPGPPMDHEVPGLEFAGRVAALGDGVDRWAIGDHVMAITAGAAHAEQVVVHADQAMAVPAGMDLDTAGALPEVFTGVRVALGVSWGTLVAAELVGAEKGLGATIYIASRFFRMDIVVVSIIIIGVIGVAMDLVMRFLERRLIPWRGKG